MSALIETEERANGSNYVERREYRASMRATLVFRNVFVGCVLLAWFARGAFAAPPPQPSIEQIRSIMAARESATYPYWLKFETTRRHGTRTFWNFSGKGSLLRHAHGYVRS